MKTYKFKFFKWTITLNFGKKKAEEIKMEEKTDDVVPFVDPSIILYTYCQEYIEAQRGVLSESTLRGYTNIIENHLGRLMRTDVGKIDNDCIQRSFDYEISKGLSKKTLKGYRTFILKVLAIYRPDLYPEIRVEKEGANENT